MCSSNRTTLVIRLQAIQVLGGMGKLRDSSEITSGCHSRGETSQNVIDASILFSTSVMSDTVAHCMRLLGDFTFMRHACVGNVLTRLFLFSPPDLFIDQATCQRCPLSGTTETPVSLRSTKALRRFNTWLSLEACSRSTTSQREWLGVQPVTS